MPRSRSERCEIGIVMGRNLRCCLVVYLSRIRRWVGRAPLFRWFRRLGEDEDPRDRNWVVLGRFGAGRLGKNAERRWRREGGMLGAGLVENGRSESGQ